MGLFKRFLNDDSALRSSGMEAIGRITAKAFVKDSGFGDCPMQIAYEFTDASGQTVTGKHVGTESNYYGLKIGDQILIRYGKSDSKMNAPRDALGIIHSVSKDARPG